MKPFQRLTQLPKSKFNNSGGKKGELFSLNQKNIPLCVIEENTEENNISITDQYTISARGDDFRTGINENILLSNLLIKRLSDIQDSIKQSVERMDVLEQLQSFMIRELENQTTQEVEFDIF